MQVTVRWLLCIACNIKCNGPRPIASNMGDATSLHTHTHKRSLLAPPGPFSTDSQRLPPCATESTDVPRSMTCEILSNNRQAAASHVDTTSRALGNVKVETRAAATVKLATEEIICMTNRFTNISAPQNAFAKRLEQHRGKTTKVAMACINRCAGEELEKLPLPCLEKCPAIGNVSSMKANKCIPHARRHTRTHARTHANILLRLHLSNPNI